MPRMRVTFTDGLKRNHRVNAEHQLTILAFQINYCGKNYDCSGHVETNREYCGKEKTVRFLGYCGYNGRINKQKLSSAAEDYYWSIIERIGLSKNPLVDGETDNTSVKPDDISAGASKSYDFYVG